MKIQITILNEMGELLDKQLTFSSLDEMRKHLWDDKNIDLLIDQAEKNGNEDGLLGVFDSKEEYEKSL